MKKVKMMKELEINNHKYILEKNKNDCFNYEETKNLVTEYFEEFDYILGDYSYDKLRLKGFCKKENKRWSKINDIESLEDYITNYCSYRANYFLLKKMA